MKNIPLIFASLAILLSDARAGEAAQKDFDPAARFLFHAVLEGLYEDGVSTDDIAQILMKHDKQSYFHFIYACPICTATIWALEAYRSRPERFYSLKSGASTFGPGLSAELHEKLYSSDSNQRLIAINSLVRSWIARRMDMMNFSEQERAEMIKQLEKKREDGMRALESFRKLEHGPGFGVAEAAPAYIDLEECAVCNGAVGKLMKLPAPK
jgi:hypothetical protein